MPRTLAPGQSAELYIYDMKSGRARLRYRSGDLLFEAPNWKPDGKDLVVNADGRLWRLGVESGDLIEIPMPGVEYINNDHVISPDGSTLAYIGLESLADGVRTNVFLIDMATREERQLTDDEFPDDGSEFSPDGEWVYFNSERASTDAGHAQLFRIPAGGGEPEQFTNDERVN